MPRVTVAFPVYNAEEMLEQSLDCILNQTFQDFKVVIADNCSTDGTQEICERYAAEFDKITYIRRTENLGANGNFLDLMHRADTEFFMWRADDDLSDLNYIEELLKVLDAHPEAKLAGSYVTTEMEQGVRSGNSPFLIRKADETLLDYAKKAVGYYHASVFYGLWRTPDVQEIFPRIVKQYPAAYAGDQLVIWSLLVQGALYGTNETTFIQRVWVRDKPKPMPRRQKLEQRIEMMEDYLPKFLSTCEHELKLCGHSPEVESELRAMIPQITRQRLRANKSRILKWKAKRLLYRALGI